ncbi:MAG: prolipoprotein diacylglyceryl transferase [Ancalomicrobiaceae bacterium]|nr:prolipoprotein diacylglyceryl transferase [Ancalomicrobiaceae bacterium]
MLFAYLPFPNFNPNAIDLGQFHLTWPVDMVLGPFAVRWYALAYIAGIVLGWWYIRRLIATKKLWGEVTTPSPVHIDDFVTWATLGIILGGRFGYVIFYDPMHYLAEPIDIPQLWHGGMSFHGAVVGLWLTMVLFARGKGFSAFTLFDLVTAAAPIGLFFGRIANFINGELWGRATDVPWAIVFPRGGPEPRHPSQLYEMALEGVVLFVVLRLVTHWGFGLKRPGTTAGVFAAGYGLARITAEFFREPDVQVGYLAGHFTMGQLLSVPMVLLGLGVVIWANRRRGATHEASG